MRQTVGILGTAVDVMNADQVLARLEQFVDQGRFHQVATANSDFLINARHDPELQHILDTADLVIADGMPVVWAARIFRNPLPERVTGADIVPRLAALAERRRFGMYLLGGKPEVTAGAAGALAQAYPALRIVGHSSPPNATLLEMDSEPILQDIERTKPDILLVALGNPKQEKWI
ncbi:MAG TPA: WecB/TagA/CpsF family glycosyltransferase, partial [Chthonomonadales bacterium]|nr:WecB/TagA/CpsF family glycosyltransferase [Chthonomonadales bacterium]